MIVIVDYGMGNLKSVENSARLLGFDTKISSSPQAVKRAKKIIFPGVGHFARAVKELKKRKLYPVLKEKIQQGTPFLGICLGMQVLFEESQEAPGFRGLGLIKGTVKRFNSQKLIIPHMGWNQIRVKGLGVGDKGNRLFQGIDDGSFFYFVHSYYCAPKEKDVILTTTDYGLEFASSIHKDNIWAVQFHAEKSQNLGLKLFNNFLKNC
ncbi:MAG: imidazole glycerol phosphate synthase subunit HisH [Candidatus Omnitrophica bacterium]|nr:imidazole glycerol phosphate synthase subunit HisH [Candidatus Omnitrophota bacterium]